MLAFLPPHATHANPQHSKTTWATLLKLTLSVHNQPCTIGPNKSTAANNTILNGHSVMAGKFKGRNNSTSRHNHILSPHNFHHIPREITNSNWTSQPCQQQPMQQ